MPLRASPSLPWPCWGCCSHVLKGRAGMGRPGWFCSVEEGAAPTAKRSEARLPCPRLSSPPGIRKKTLCLLYLEPSTGQNAMLGDTPWGCTPSRDRRGWGRQADGTEHGQPGCMKDRANHPRSREKRAARRTTTGTQRGPHERGARGVSAALPAAGQGCARRESRDPGPQRLSPSPWGCQQAAGPLSAAGKELRG